MLHLKSIELANFKGVSQLNCDFEDLTVLAGLNNSGKTTILQATYLLLGSLPNIAVHPHIEHPNVEVRMISLDNALSPLGLQNSSWLSSAFASGIAGIITGVFYNSLQVELRLPPNSSSPFAFTLSQLSSSTTPARPLRDLIGEVSQFSAAILTPPGEVPSRETMTSGPEYQNFMRQGRGAQLWRNGIWWGIRTDGFETFAPVQEKISKYFPDIELLLPTLSSQSSPPEILIKYKERGYGPLDIAQSGAGLRTFVSLTRILEQSTAEIILLDEPDAHLHASQQAVILDMMLDAATRLKRQVIIASHSPEIISRVPAECLRWIERGSAKAQGEGELGGILERLGATPDIYIPRAALPDVLVYVEGVKDRPIVEALLKWCRRKSARKLPTTLVIPHRDGRFEGPTLHGISRFVKEYAGSLTGSTIVGVRDKDWYYDTLPADGPDVLDGDGWSLITLPCKEMENLFCDPAFLLYAYEERLSREVLERIVDVESQNPELVDEWRYQVRPRIRDRLSNALDPSTKEKNAEEIFNAWVCDAAIRRRLVAGKRLFGRVRNRVREEHSLTFYPERAFEKISHLTPTLLIIAQHVFPAGSLEGLG
jgi:hypothetical protein